MGLLKTVAALLLVGVIAGAGGSWWVVHQWDQPHREGPQQLIDIPAGVSFRTAARLLEQQGIIGSARQFEVLARWQKQAAFIHPGEYALSPTMTPRQVLDTMVQGQVVLHPVTLPEGLTVVEILQRLEAAKLGKVSDFRQALTPALAAEYGLETAFTKEPFEGYLFPDTYLFPKGASPESIIRAMLDRMQAAFTPQRLARAQALGWRRHQVLTMASLIEKETAAPEERARISAVFHNRLKKRMRLQTDPTVIYAIPDFDGNIRRVDLKRKDPYNTYTNRGLPPGPIASSGEAAIDAALNPVADNALYFVSRGDGTHFFSTNVRDHNRAVRRFRP